MGLQYDLEAMLERVDLPLPLDADKADAGHADKSTSREQAYWLERRYKDSAFAGLDSDLDLNSAVTAAAIPAPGLADIAAHPAHIRRRALAQPCADYPDHTHDWTRSGRRSLSRIAARGL